MHPRELKGDGVVRILVADDSKRWREVVSGLLQRDSRLSLVAEAFDGSQAVAVAKQVKPDLILLDINMPALNGLDAARNIRMLLPQTRILFVSGESDHDVVSAALEAGALGYVLKCDAGKALLPAIHTVMAGHCFISDGLLSSSTAQPSFSA